MHVDRILIFSAAALLLLSLTAYSEVYIQIRIMQTYYSDAALIFNHAQESKSRDTNHFIHVVLCVDMV